MLRIWCWHIVDRIWEVDCSSSRERLAYARKVVREALDGRGVTFPNGRWETIRRGVLKGRSYRQLDLLGGYRYVWANDGGLDLSRRRGVGQYTWAERAMVTLMEDALEPELARRRQAGEKRLRAARKQSQRDADKLQPSQSLALKIDEFHLAKSERARAFIAGQIVYSRALTALGAHWGEAGRVLGSDGLLEALRNDCVAREYLELAVDVHSSLSAALRDWNVEEWELSRMRASAGGRNSSSRKIDLAAYVSWKVNQPEDISRSEEARLLKIGTATVSRYRAEMHAEVERLSRDTF